MAEATYERLSLEKEQVDTALDLFLDHRNYASAITLAAAAEEIFGCSHTAKGCLSALYSSYISMAEFHQMRYGEVLDKRKFVSKENRARDALKHLQRNWVKSALDAQALF
jgi:hypothetical protein